jgi:hypothetical protein
MCLVTKIRGPFAKFVDSLYYSESELCEGAVTVSFSKYLPWQAMHFLQRSTQFSKTCCRLFITLKFLASELPFHGWKSPEIPWGEIWTVWRMLMGFHQSMFSKTNTKFNSDLAPMRFLGSSEVINGLQHVFEKWVERCKKCIACQGRYFEKQTVTARPQSSNSE